MERGEVLRAETGAMVAMSPGMELKAKTSGKGMLGALTAMVGGEGFFASEYCALTDGAEIILAPSGPGDIVHLALSEQTVFAQSGAYLAGSESIQLSTQGSLKALVSGEGLFLQKISGPGDVWLASYGAILIKELGPDEEYIVDTGHLVAFESSVGYKLAKASQGLFSTLASGEGLVCRFRGPGKIWMQSRNMVALARLIQPYIPKGK